MPPPLPPSLPSRPSNSFVQPQAVDFALRSALTNPYSQGAYSSHYAQAYTQQFSHPGMPLRNAEGYTMSSTYNPNTYMNNQYSFQPVAGSSSTSRLPHSSSGGPVKFQSFSQANSTWYQPGHDRCTYRGCSFTGSAKSVETHMMDRHLIYPPGWDKRKKIQDWDADPSLKGKPIPIQGTNLVLNTPDAIEAWVEERKKRWPSNSLIADKKRKFDEASARGELAVDSLGLFSKKRRNNPLQNHDRSRGEGGRGRGLSDLGWRGRGSRGRGRGRGGANVVVRPEASTEDKVFLPEQPANEKAETEEDNSDDEPEVLSSKLPPKPSFSEHEQQVEAEREATSTPSTTTTNFKTRKPPPQPRKPPHNPFAPRTSLLRNLLLPEIRMTVSNLSQAIRFLVDNDFLDDVELKPGEAASKPIQVIHSGTTEDNSDSL